MLEILSNGSKWCGEQPDTVKELTEALNKYTLDPRFEDYGNFMNNNSKWLKPELAEKYKNCVKFFGNFLTYSHVFNIITDEPETITALTEAIENNKKSTSYQDARNEYIRRKEYKKEMERKWINKEISYQEYNNAIV